MHRDASVLSIIAMFLHLIPYPLPSTWIPTCVGMTLTRSNPRIRDPLKTAEIMATDTEGPTNIPFPTLEILMKF